MITYSNIRRYDGLDFDDYLKTEGYSYSFLKGEQSGIEREVKNSDKIMLGKLVDAILTEPEKADMMSPLYSIARDIASSIRKDLPYINNFAKQVSFCGIAEYKGFKLPVRGRLDYYLKGSCILDLKVTSEKNIDALIAFMGYENQLWHYAKLAEVKSAYLLIYSVPLKKTFLRVVGCSGNYSEFWSDKIIKFGKV